jgi:outer membrane protein OmpA-like peptidoglycan-associated protein
VKTKLHNLVHSRHTLIAAGVAAALLAACATAPTKPDGADQARNDLVQLQSDPNLATRAPVAIAAAEAAVRAAEQPEPDKELAAYRVYIANAKVDTARADAETRFEEDQRVTLTAQREAARLAARTREANASKLQASNAQLQAANAQAAEAAQRSQADSARAEAQAANSAAELAASTAEQRAAEYQKQIDALQAKVTERGLVLTLGDVLFATGRAELMAGASTNLNKLVSFLGKYPERTAAIEGYTDSVGSADYNQGLSERRADAVRSYLIAQGIDSARLSATGKGARSPVAGNDTAEGRQQNRRVEVIINNPATALR